MSVVRHAKHVWVGNTATIVLSIAIYLTLKKVFPS